MKVYSIWSEKWDYDEYDEVVVVAKDEDSALTMVEHLFKEYQLRYIHVDVELKEVTPPDILYHGTATKSLDGIKQQGIKSMSRLYVHLSKDLETAIKVGDRHGKCVVLAIDTKRMFDDGIKFYLSENGVWLTKYVDWKYVKEIKYTNN